MPKKSLLLIGCLSLVTLFSISIAVTTLPRQPGWFGVAFATISIASFFLRVGWFVPLTFVGVYAGMVSDGGVKGGTHESQMWETVSSIVGGAILGFIIGAIIDSTSTNGLPPPNVIRPSKPPDKAA